MGHESGKKSSRVVKCEGRFSELRNYLYDEAIPTVIDGRTSMTGGDLIDVWDLVKDDVMAFDVKDPYFGNRGDLLRREPPANYLSLVPLVESSFHLQRELYEKYGVEMGNSKRTSEILGAMSLHPGHFLDGTLGRDSSKVFLAEHKNLAGYLVSGNTGIGTISSGGIKGGGVRSDCPFLLEIYENQQNRGEQNLVATVGFWPQNSAMLVAQMQPCKNAHFPNGVPFGVGCLEVAEVAARLMGFKEIASYSARMHPIFREHPENWGQLGPEFVCLWDGSTSKLGYNGSRTGYHVKSLGNH